MSTVSLRIPDSLHRRVRELARKDKTSINQFIATALAEKISALMAVEYLEDRARRGSRRKFERALSRVRDVPPGDYDEM
jgi:hypothetical protein